VDGGGSAWWDAFYADRDRKIPFSVAKPDENLVFTDLAELELRRRRPLPEDAPAFGVPFRWTALFAKP
jgi:hypothetical protein